MSKLDQAKAEFSGKKVLILGLGLNQGGLGSTLFFAQAGATVRVTDLKSKEELQPTLDQLKDYPKISYTLGQHQESDIDWADLVIKNPALKPDNPYVQYALKQGKPVEQDIGILLEFVSPQQMIGITGTKGKSTTTSLIYELARQTGRPVVLGGNIGLSVLDSLAEINDQTLLVLELSSFQMEAFHQHQVSPHWAVITNIFPDHLNYHGSMAEYINAKRGICAYQTDADFILLNRHNPVTTAEEFLAGLKGQVIYFSHLDLPSDLETTLVGEHNLDNLAAGWKLGQLFNLTDAVMRRVIKDFQAPPYRLQLVKDYRGVRIYNDSTATNPGAAIASIKAVPNSIVIVGGTDKGLAYDELAETLATAAAKIFFLDGPATTKLLQVLQDSPKNMGVYDDLEILLREVLAMAQPGDTVLFSPGAASFNMFKNEFDRGEKFNQLVERLTAP